MNCKGQQFGLGLTQLRPFHGEMISIKNSQIAVSDGLFERPSLIRLAYKGKYSGSFSVGIKNIVSRPLEYCMYLSTYSVDIKYIISRH